MKCHPQPGTTAGGPSGLEIERASGLAVGTIDHTGTGKEESIPKRFEDPIEVPPNVLDGLEAVRESGEPNMLDLPVVEDLASFMGHPETALWIREHRREYLEGIFRGFVATE